ncbi:MAG: hypothetical protein RIC35_09555 [Marinoscillum sp.]
MRTSLIISTALLVTLFTSCEKDPSSEVSISKTSLSVDEQVTVTLSNLENVTCTDWGINFDGDYTVISGGGGNDLTFTVSFQSVGEASIYANPNFCKKKKIIDKAECSCEEGRVEVNILDITVE